MGEKNRLGVLRHTNFRNFFFGETVNTAGSSMSGVALAFAVLHISDSATALGWVVASWTVPMVAFMLLGGANADRLPRALVLRGCNLTEGVAQGVAAALVITGHAQIWQLCVLQFVSGSAVAVSYPAFHGMVPILLEPTDRKSAYLLIGQARSALRIIGPSAAGVLVAVVNPGWALLVDAATFFVAAVFLTLLRLPPHTRAAANRSVVSDVAQGWGFARSLGWVLPVATCSLVYNAVISGGLGVLGPVISNGTTIGSQGWGLARGPRRWALPVRVRAASPDNPSAARGVSGRFRDQCAADGGAGVAGLDDAGGLGDARQRLRQCLDQPGLEPHRPGEGARADAVPDHVDRRLLQLRRDAAG